MDNNNAIRIAEYFLIAATFLGPIFAVQAQKWIERIREKDKRRQWIFYTLMATRAVRAASNEHVQALNLIDLVFHGKSEKDKSVRNAWAVYLDFLTSNLPNTEAEAASHNEKGVDLLVNLLAALAKALGYDFNAVQLKRGVYYPQGQHLDIFARTVIRDNLARILCGEQAVKMSVVSLPVTDEALKRQTVVQDELIEVLSGQKSIKIRVEK